MKLQMRGVRMIQGMARYGYTNLPDISPNADRMQRGWVIWAGDSGLPLNQVVTTVPRHARSRNEGWEEEEEEEEEQGQEQRAEDPPGLHEVGQLHAHIRMVKLGEEEVQEEVEDEPARGLQEARPVQGPDNGPVQQRRIFETVASFLGRQLDEK